MYRFRDEGAYVWFLVAGAIAALAIVLADGVLQVVAAVVVVAITAFALLTEVTSRRRDRG